MNVSMHQVAICDAVAQKSDGAVNGHAHFVEQGGRTGTLSLFFQSAEDCQAAADGLAELARQMREGEAVR